MDKCTKYINLFLFSLFQSCTQHFYHGRQYGNHNNGHNQQKQYGIRPHMIFLHYINHILIDMENKSNRKSIIY